MTNGGESSNLPTKIGDGTDDERKNTQVLFILAAIISSIYSMESRNPFFHRRYEKKAGMRRSKPSGILIPCMDYVFPCSCTSPKKGLEKAWNWIADKEHGKSSRHDKLHTYGC